MIPFRPVIRSPGFYPITSFYLGAIAVLVLTSRGFFTLPLGVVMLAIMAVGSTLVAAWRDLHAVHLLVNGQKHELMTEIADLKRLLRSANVQVPASPSEKRDQTPKEDSDE